MLVFLDESGDLSSNKKNNTRYFNVACLITPNYRPIEKVIKKAHAQLRKKEKKQTGGMLHAHKERPAIREKLLNDLSRKECSLVFIYLDKRKLFNTHQTPQELYNQLVHTLIDHLYTKMFISHEQNIRLIASQRETNAFLNETFKEYLNFHIQSNHDPKFQVDIQKPVQHKGLQAVDFVSWAYFRSLEHGENGYYEIIQSKIEEEIAFL